MVNPIGTTATTIVASEAVNKNAVTEPKTMVETQTAAAEQIAPKLDKVQHTPESEKPKNNVSKDPEDKKGSSGNARKATAKGETRKLEFNEKGNLTVKVYDSSGRLVRKIPPGYLPTNEQEVNIVA